MHYGNYGMRAGVVFGMVRLSPNTMFGMVRPSIESMFGLVRLRIEWVLFFIGFIRIVKFIVIIRFTNIYRIC